MENSITEVNMNYGQVVPSKGITTEQTVNDLYRYAEEDRVRAIDAYNDLKCKVDNASRITPGMLEALNGAQNLIQSSTDKLIHIAKLTNSKDNVKTLNQMNLNFSSDILNDQNDELDVKMRKLGVGKK